MADETTTAPAAPGSATPPVTDMGAGTSAPPAPAKPDPATQPGGPDFDVDNASDADYKRHKEILKRRKEVADLTVVPATPLVAVPSSTAPAPATFTAPSAPLTAYYNSKTQQTVHLPAALYDKLSDEDRADLTTSVEKPEPLATA